MKNIIFFVTHKTLTLEHADLVFNSFSKQNCSCMFDRLYIYNSHSDELSNNTLLDLFKKYILSKHIKEVLIFPYNLQTPKTLGSDINSIREYCINNYASTDRVLIIKSDTLLSVNYFDDILNKVPKDKLIYFVAPFVCAKKRVPNEIILEYSNRDTFIKSDNITYFVEDQYQSNNNDFYTRPGVSVEDTGILFTACYVIRDFSCHFLSVGLFNLVVVEERSWAGVNFNNLIPYFIETDRSFTIHKYHDIRSENRETGREGPVEQWITS